MILNKIVEKCNGEKIPKTLLHFASIRKRINMTMKKRGNKGCCIFTLFVFAGVCLALAIVGGMGSIDSGIFGPKIVISNYKPRPGYWSGEKYHNYAHFFLTADGKIEGMYIQPDNHIGVPTGCTAIWEESYKLEDNQISSVIKSSEKFVNVPAHNEFEGFYGSDDKFHGTFRIQICGQWQVSKIEGDWEAGWVSEKKPNIN